MSLEDELKRLFAESQGQLVQEIRSIIREEIALRPEPEEIRANQLSQYRPAFRWGTVRKTWADKLSQFTRKDGGRVILNLKAFDETVRPKHPRPEKKDWVQMPGSKLRIPRSQAAKLD